MSEHSNDELNEVLRETGELLRGEEVSGSYELDDILAEYGSRQEDSAQNAEDAADAAEEAVEQVICEEVAEETVEETVEETPEETMPEAWQEKPDRPEGHPGEPEGEVCLSLEQVMAQTVGAVLAEGDEILTPRVTLRERLDALKQRIHEKKNALQAKLLKKTERDEQPPAEPPEEPEPDMELTAKQMKRLCQKWYKRALYMALPCVALVILSVLDNTRLLRSAWQGKGSLRCLLCAVLLAAAAVLAKPVWEKAWEELHRRHIGCELAAAFSGAVVLLDCLWGAIKGREDNLPFAAAGAVLMWLCMVGLILSADAKREAYHLADLGGEPPYAVAVTAVGACKQRGKLTGFYRMAEKDDPTRRWQTRLLPVLMAAATVLALVVCAGDHKMDRFLWIWSAMLTASLPLSLPLTGTLALSRLNRRLNRSGSTVAGCCGAQMVSLSRRMVVTDDDLVPPGTVGLNGLKIYGEELGKVVSYAAAVTKEAGSQLSSLFGQLLSCEGGFVAEVQDLHYYEEGGVGCTIDGESVTMGSAYFMRSRKVALPRELKVKTGVFLAVDGQLIAIFAIKYQPSRNVEWALQAIRRNRIQPVLAVRGGNITPGMLHRRFNLDVKPLYPDVSTRLALSDLCGETVEQPGAIIYREGLLPFAETVIGSRRLLWAMRLSTVLCYVGAVAGLLLSYYLTHVGGYALLGGGQMLAFLLLWLLPTLLLSGLVRHF